MKRKCIALLLVMMTVFAFFCSGALAAERDSISVNGHASAEVAPDMATLYGNLEKRAAVAETARDNLARHAIKNKFSLGWLAFNLCLCPICTGQISTPCPTI